MICRYCGGDKDEKEFEVANTVGGKVYRRRKCRECKNVTQAARVRKNREWLNEFKKGKVCFNCGFSDYRALTFHHRDPKTKDRNVSEMPAWAIDTMQKEIDKCDILCCNCHMILEAQLRGYE